MPRTKEQYEQIRSKTKNKIRSAGLQLFSHKGLNGTSIQEIATSAGISTGLMYRHYKSKEDLFNDLVNTAIHAGKALESLLNSDDCPSAILKQLSDGLMHEMNKSDESAQYLVLITHSLMLGDLEQEMVESYNSVLFDQMTNLIRRGQSRGDLKPGDPYQMTLLFFSTLQGLAMMKLSLIDRFVCPSSEMLTAYLIKES
ncbi:TetR/AcrR family transcriptional regulator [Paenibacillus sp. WQ 127069]|uniref:TetR/AcrR family transcriptional regulator n=1 Tax=Paenibacillus baimaensis TaxID=2982185 RepID=A0ABT2UKF1_9BACL|nr:TetR/AcrR family transcriptional regulator [Paenibacillus sp. WQ 127069]MCU6795122.1 TetR/AcrR family transcriptional regulator [Paenibacillus sp. WQ 127069]